MARIYIPDFNAAILIIDSKLKTFSGNFNIQAKLFCGIRKVQMGDVEKYQHSSNFILVFK